MKVYVVLEHEANHYDGPDGTDIESIYSNKPDAEKRIKLLEEAQNSKHYLYRNDNISYFFEEWNILSNPHEKEIDV